MIKYFCDRCGKEIDLDNCKGFSLQIRIATVTREITEDISKTGFLCRGCGLALHDFLKELRENNEI